MKDLETPREPLTGCARSFGRFLRDQAGASFVITALSFPVILGFAGLGLDATMWYMGKRQNQTIADSAAVAGRIALSRDASLSQGDLEIVVRGAAADNGFVHGSHGAVTVNNPPAAGPNAGDANFIEVVIAQQAQTYFSGMMLNESFMVRTRAVTGISTFGSHCVVALDPTADGAITVTGTADLTSDCGMASNSSSDQAILVTGSASLTAQPLQSHGDIYKSSTATVSYDAPPQPLSERVEDPYAGVLPGLQADPSCVGASAAVFGKKDSPLAPGRFCGGLSIEGGGSASFELLPGTYILDNGDLTVSGSLNVIGEGVTFIITAMDVADLGVVEFTGTGSIDLRAPADASEGEYPGMLVIQDPYVPGAHGYSPMPLSRMSGGADMSLDGAIYLPDQEINYTGGSSGGVSCTLIVARKVTFDGSVFLDNDATACAEAGVTTGIQQTRVRIME
jgi:Flp pilus assembly protein TadG